MTKKLIRMGKHGQITIPAEMLKPLGWGPEAVLELAIGKNRFTLKKFTGKLKEREINPKKIMGRKFPVMRDMLDPRITAEQVQEILERHFKILAKGSSWTEMFHPPRPHQRKFGISPKEYMLRKYHENILSYYGRIYLHGLPEYKRLDAKKHEEADKFADKIYSQRLAEIRKDWETIRSRYGFGLEG